MRRIKALYVDMKYKVYVYKRLKTGFFYFRPYVLYFTFSDCSPYKLKQMKFWFTTLKNFPKKRLTERHLLRLMKRNCISRSEEIGADYFKLKSNSDSKDTVFIKKCSYEVQGIRV